MDQLLKMAADAGMTKEQGKAASGGIFSLVKKTLDSGDYNKILQKIPEIKGVVVSNHEESTKNAAASGQGGDGGLAASTMSALGSSGAGGSAGGVAALFTALSSKGVNAKELSAFIPQLTSFVQWQCGADIGKILRVSAAATAAEGAAPDVAKEEAHAGAFVRVMCKPRTGNSIVSGRYFLK
jgi:hypothetical protein